MDINANNFTAPNIFDDRYDLDYEFNQRKNGNLSPSSDIDLQMLCNNRNFQCSLYQILIGRLKSI